MVCQPQSSIPNPRQADLGGVHLESGASRRGQRKNLPGTTHGTIFNHSTTALEFQRSLFKRHAVDLVLNLVDYQFFLLGEPDHPAIVMIYRKEAPENRRHSIEYWGPKTDWLVQRAEVIAVMPEDRCTLSTGEVLDDLEGTDAPQIWKQRYRATARDRRLIDRLSLYARLRDQVRQTEKETVKRWVIAEGFQPLGENDDPKTAKPLRLTSRLFIEASSSKLDLFLSSSECTQLPSNKLTVEGLRIHWYSRLLMFSLQRDSRVSLLPTLMCHSDMPCAASAAPKRIESC